MTNSRLYSAAPNVRVPKITKKHPFGRILNYRTKEVDGVTYVLHTTKGWRKA